MLRVQTLWLRPRRASCQRQITAKAWSAWWQGCSTKRPKQTTSSYNEGALFESPLMPKKLPPMGKYTSNLPPPTPVILFSALETPKDVLKFLGEQDKVVSWYSHVPPAAARADKATWAGPVDSAKKLVMKTAADAAQKICAVLCGGAEDAGAALWDRVRFDGADFWREDGPAQRTLMHTVAECYVKAPKSSIEKRVLRACLTSLKREVDILELSAVVTELTMVAKSFTRGRTDLKALQLGATLARNGTVSESTFYRIASTITAGDAKMQKAVDYVVVFLVNDAVDVLKQVLQVLDEQQRLSTHPNIEYNAAYLKYGFDARLHDPSAGACILHQIEFGLSRKAKDETSGTMCRDCKEVFAFYQRLKNHLVVADAAPSTLGVVDDCCDKARFFLGHRLCVVNQQQAIAKLVQEIRDRCAQQGWPDEALLIIDFKMKLEPLYFREKTVDHYGKRGMSWHGTLVQHFTVNGDQEGSGAIDQRVYYDHISQGDTKQDREAVISMIEAILMRIKRDLPHVKRLVIQSDNASAYQNTLLPLMFPYVSVVHGIAISCFIHTETQDGKSVLDAYFSWPMQVLRTWVREGNNYITPTQAVVGLKNHGGLPNCVMELVDHDRTALELLTKEVEGIKKEFRRFVKRAKDVYIDTSSMQLPNELRYRACPDFKLTVFEYSGIGSGCTVQVKPSAGTCILVSPSDTADSEAVLTSTGNQNEEALGDEMNFELEEITDVNGHLDTLIDGGDEVQEGDADVEEAAVDDAYTIDPTLFAVL